MSGRVSAPCHWPGVVSVTVADLTPADIGRRVQIPGNRGVLRGVWTDDDGLVAVCTTVGIGHYAPETLCWRES